MRRGVVLVATAVLASLLAVPVAGRAAEECDAAWPMYGRDLTHSFSQDPGCAAITTTNVATLVPKWSKRTLDSVTASPTVVDGTVYVGSWDGVFYALDAETGAERWTFEIDDHDKHAVAFGRIVSSAAVADFKMNRRVKKQVVLFGGGATLFALDAKTGAMLAALDVDPRSPEQRAADPDHAQQVEIESSPAVVGNTIYFGMDVHNDEAVGRTGLISASLTYNRRGWKLTPNWKFDPESAQVYEGEAGLTQGAGTGWGCGGVWSSPAVDIEQNLVFFGTANCNNVQQAKDAGLGWAETMWAIRADTGEPVWHHRPAADIRNYPEECVDPTSQACWDAQKAEAHADDDFGASPNLFTTVEGTKLVGQGRKSAHYYARDRQTGAEEWTTVAGHHGRVDHNYSIGGFLGTTAIQRDEDGRALRIIGTTALPVPRPDQEEFPDSVDRSTWSVRALDPVTGEIEWVWRLAGPSYGAPTVANGVVFVPDTFTDTLMALDAETGTLLAARPMLGPPASAPAVVGDSVYLGGGTRETDAEYKAIRDTGIDTQQLASAVGPHPLSPLSGIFAYRVAA